MAMGKHISHVALLAFLIFRKLGVLEALLPALFPGGCQDRAPGSRAGRQKGICVQPSHAWPKDSNARRQAFHLTSPAGRAWLCAWCLRVIMIKNSRHYLLSLPQVFALPRF